MRLAVVPQEMVALALNSLQVQELTMRAVVLVQEEIQLPAQQVVLAVVAMLVLSVLQIEVVAVVAVLALV
jgi:hypothetical protein